VGRWSWIRGEAGTGGCARGRGRGRQRAGRWAGDQGERDGQMYTCACMTGKPGDAAEPPAAGPAPGCVGGRACGCVCVGLRSWGLATSAARAARWRSDLDARRPVAKLCEKQLAPPMFCSRRRFQLTRGLGPPGPVWRAEASVCGCTPTHCLFPYISGARRSG
jgi:hypothetical protein